MTESKRFEEHLEDFRATFIQILIIVGIGFLFSFLFYQQIYKWLLLPLGDTKPIILGPLEGLSTTMKLSFWIGLVATSPLWIIRLLQFVTPALHPHEKRVLFPIVILTFIAMALGFAFGYYLVIPAANSYLETFNASIGQNLWSLTLYLNYTVFLILSSGLALELGLLLFLLVHLGALSPDWMASKRRYAVICAFILGAILTPPDILTQACVAIPLIFLYEGAILYGRVKNRKSNT